MKIHFGLGIALSSLFVAAALVGCTSDTERAPAPTTPTPINEVGDPPTTPPASSIDRPAAVTTPGAGPVVAPGVTQESFESASMIVGARAKQCEAFKATTTPEGKHDIVDSGGFGGKKLIDVYAYEYGAGSHRTLNLALTETAHQCSYTHNNVIPHDMNEVRILLDVERPIAPGTYGAQPDEKLSLTWEAGQRCETWEEFKSNTNGWSGTAIAGASATGSITITKRTDTLIEGSVDVVDAGGKHIKGSFSAPICGMPSAYSSDEWYCCSR